MGTSPKHSVPNEQRVRYLLASAMQARRANQVALATSLEAEAAALAAEPTPTVALPEDGSHASLGSLVAAHTSKSRR